MDLGRPYQERWPVGAQVRVAPLADLEAFMRDYKYHHKLRPEQLKYADVGDNGSSPRVLSRWGPALYSDRYRRLDVA